MPTIGIDFYSWKAVVPDCPQQAVQLWETSGQKRFLPILDTFLRHSNVIVIVYDTRESPTFWLDHIRKSIDFSATFVTLLGHQLEEGYRPSRNEDLDEVPHFTCNAKTGYGVHEAFDGILREYLARHSVQEPSANQTEVPLIRRESSRWWTCCG